MRLARALSEEPLGEALSGVRTFTSGKLRHMDPARKIMPPGQMLRPSLPTNLAFICNGQNLFAPWAS